MSWPLYVKQCFQLNTTYSWKLLNEVIIHSPGHDYEHILGEATFQWDEYKLYEDDPLYNNSLCQCPDWNWWYIVSLTSEVLLIFQSYAVGYIFLSDLLRLRPTRFQFMCRRVTWDVSKIEYYYMANGHALGWWSNQSLMYGWQCGIA